MWVRGLKPLLAYQKIVNDQSHPMWVRGLKQEDIKRLQDTKKSHPMWVRGLKPIRTCAYLLRQ